MIKRPLVHLSTPSDYGCSIWPRQKSIEAERESIGIDSPSIWKQCLALPL